MWPPWGKSTGRNHTSTTSSSNFTFSTFKDIQSLCKEEPQLDHLKNPSIFHRIRVSRSVLRTWSSCSTLPDLPPEPNAPPPLPSPDPSITLVGAEKRIVVYFTSLRVVRKTFEDCRTVRSILRGFRLSIDERDLSMDAGFFEELQGILGRKNLTLPRVFIGGRYVGGADEIRQLHETGELKKFVEGFPAAEPGVCDGCAGFQFILCDQCNGSHKCYVEKGGFRSCSACNENGLIRPDTSSSSLEFLHPVTLPEFLLTDDLLFGFSSFSGCASPCFLNPVSSKDETTRSEAVGMEISPGEEPEVGTIQSGFGLVEAWRLSNDSLVEAEEMVSEGESSLWGKGSRRV
ncbi:hypothetical protein HHK36_018814 [Tetracentron sinense]|uniref:Glutaredoxin domain-containing protein n=1 Tax=Tetracentron sinense TaxID=13715 RepID=A0A835DBM7_TETSI|nr:hypothetical protein HHK36_018814 [Tetracentron sinense]